MQELLVFNQSVLQRISQPSEIALHYTPIIAYYRFLRLTYLYIIFINDSLLPAQHEIWPRALTKSRDFISGLPMLLALITIGVQIDLKNPDDV